MKYLLLASLLFTSLLSTAQEPLNYFKYIVVAQQYDFQSEPDKFNFNDLAVFLLKKNGLNVFTNGGVLPADYNKGTCNALNLKITKSGFLETRLDVSFEDCDNNVVFKTQTGKSRKKTFEKAYHEALRDALSSLDGYTYKYMPATVTNNSLNETLTEVEEVIIATPDNNNSDHNLIKPSSINVTHQTNDSQYKLTKKGESNFEIYVFSNLVGTMRQIGNGNYIVSIESHNGIGYVQDKNIVVEYEVDGSLKKLVFLPIAKN